MIRKFIPITLACLALAVGFAPRDVGAADNPAKAGSGRSAEELARQRQMVADQIAQLTKADDPEAKDSPAAPDKDKEDLLPLLRSLDAVYAQQQSRLDERKALEAQTREADKQLEALDKFAPDEPKPYSFLLLEGLKDQLAVEEERATALKTDLKSAEQMLKGSHTELDAREHERQAAGAKNTKAGEKVAASANPEMSTRTEAAVALARAKVGLKQLEIEVGNLRLELSKSTQKQLEKKIEVVEKDVKFTAQDRNRQLERLAASEAALKRQRRETETKLEQLSAEQQAALKELGESKAPEKDAANSAFRAAAEAYENEVVILDQRIESLVDVRRQWKRRFEVTNGAVDAQKLAQWLDDLDEVVDQQEDLSKSLEHRREMAQVAPAPTSTSAAPQEADEGVAKWKNVEQARLRELRDLCEASLQDIKATDRTFDRFHDELKAKVKKVATAWGRPGKAVSALLAYPIAGDEDDPINVGQLLLLLAVVAVGIVAAYFVSKVVGRRLLPRLGLHQGTIVALKSMLFYALCILFAVVSFQLLHIPAAAFAFVGGAAAIAVGFGGQDIMNNFMSGIILLTEQPIRVGDIVQIGGTQGQVLHIGLRSTRLQTDVNHEMIVPNKSLIDEQVTNLTLSDNFVQTFVIATLERDVGVEQAKWKMQEVAFNHPMVLKSPRPVVLLKEVETYWLTFEIHFWLEQISFIKSMMVQSEILEVVSDMYRPPKEERESSEAASPADAEGADATPQAEAMLPGLKKMSRAVIAKELKRLGGGMLKA